ncbi:hypothetical protein [Photorhabdus bodei]|uniref:hypothetical protein n=1 Tax=Photorhabdus bodei TaxID=2029681 RepID=UPI001EE3B354|nr:hypothetical protein [Photorhabdus bodei]
MAALINQETQKNDDTKLSVPITESATSDLQWSWGTVGVSIDTYANFEHFEDWLPGFIADSLPDGWGRLLMDRFLRRNAALTVICLILNDKFKVQAF